MNLVIVLFQSKEEIILLNINVIVVKKEVHQNIPERVKEEN